MTKKEKIHMIAESLTDNADIIELTTLFYELQCEYLESLSDKDLEIEYQETFGEKE